MRNRVLEVSGPDELAPAAIELMANYDFDFAIVRGGLTKYQLERGGQTDQNLWLAEELQDVLIDGGAIDPNRNWAAVTRSQGIQPHIDHHTFRFIAVSARVDQSKAEREFFGLQLGKSVETSQNHIHAALSEHLQEVNRLKGLGTDWRREMSSAQQKPGDICLVAGLPVPSIHAVDVSGEGTSTIVTLPRRTSAE